MLILTTQKLSKMQEDILAYLAINPAAPRKDLALHIENSTEDGSSIITT